MLWLMAACIGTRGLLHVDSSKVRKIPVSKPKGLIMSSTVTKTLQLRSHSLAVVRETSLSWKMEKSMILGEPLSGNDKRLMGHSRTCIQICRIDISILD